MAMNDCFAVFILTHGRPDRVKTYSTLRNQGYTGEIYLIVDNEDNTVDEYRRIYGDKVIVFDKLAIANSFDTGDNFPERRSVFFARNASFAIAKDLGLDYFLQLDDDYIRFYYKFTTSLEYTNRIILNLDRLFMAFLTYYKSLDAVTIAMAQNGDFIGGRESNRAQKIGLLRKCMNTFFCCTKRPFEFVARVNEDVATYTSLGHRGLLLLTVVNSAVKQIDTQKNKGGMTELYEAEGTYIKSFYPVMYCPSFVTISMMGDKHRRLHHQIAWGNAVPCILNEKYRKVG